MKRVVQLMKRVVRNGSNAAANGSRSATSLWELARTTWAGSPCASEALPMEIAQVKRFLRAFADGKKLNTVIIRELYLSGYIGIESHSPGKEPLPTLITEKGKRVLET
jgi:hypothetical protein